jgi:transketolase
VSALAVEVRAGSPEWVARHGLSTIDASRLAQLELARRDPRIYSVEADLGDCGGLPFRDELPRRFIDVGIAEASLVGVAAGLALAGKIPLVNTFAAFALMRACEQVRLDVCYHRANVKIFGTFTGVQSGFSGPSHHCLEDLAIARALPGMAVLAPADAVAAYELTHLAVARPGPVYVRLGMADTEQVYGEGARFEVGRGTVLRRGGDLTLVGAGLILPQVLAASERLARRGIDARVIDLCSVKPIDAELLVEAARETGRLVTVEEHSVLGGAGGAVAEVLAALYPVPVKILGLPDAYCEELGTHGEHLARYGLDPAGIAAAVEAFLQEKG